METTCPSPAKRLRITDNANGQITECIREFKLPQQFPSMVSPKGNNSTLKAKYLTNANITKNIKLIPAKDANTFNKMKKLKLKSLDGKDLGEVSVQLVPHLGDTKVVTLSKPGMFKNVSKPISLSFVTNQDKTTKLLKFPQPLPTLQISNVKSLDQVLSLDNTNSNNTISTNEKHKSTTDNKNNLTNQQLVIWGNKTKEELRKSNQSQNGNVRNRPRFIPIRPKDSQVKVLQLEPINGNQKYIKIQNPKVLITTGNSTINKINNPDNIKVLMANNKLQNTSNVMHVRLPDLMPIDNKKSTESIIPVAQCDKLGLTNINDKEIKETYEQQPKEKIVVKSWSNWSTVDDFESVKKPLPQPNLHENGIEKSESTTQYHNGVTNKSNSTDQVDFQKMKALTLGKNIMVMVHNGSSPLNINVAPVQNQQSNVESKDESVSNGFRNSMKVKPQGSDCSRINKYPEEEIAEPQDSLPIYNKELSDRLSIVGKALSSVEDNELRTKALKALADCGIGMERFVPISVPKHLKTVHDSKVQTDVFGLLDVNSFVLVRDDAAPIERINQTERSTLDSISNNIGVNTGYKLQLEESLSMPFSLTLGNDPFFDVPNVLNDLCIDNEGASKVQQALNKSQSVFKKVCEQLRKDIDNAKKYDENGLLNIHKAVINDRVNDVQRHLLILNNSKYSVDIPTRDGMTSLELAMKYNVSSTIVKVLLENGASPVSSVPAHDSALILASKLSLPVLSDLVKYVPSVESFDLIDSEGFAALHYCAKNGNLDNVKILLDAGANINLKDNRSGRTALFHALENNHITLGQYLLDRGANATVTNFAGQNVLSLIDNVKNLTFKTSLSRMVE